MPITIQCELLGLSRASVYYRPRGVSEADLALMRRLDELHLEHPFLGARKLARVLSDEGLAAVGRRHVTTLMHLMGMEAIYRKPRTSLPDKGHKIYPYLLTGVVIERANQVWATDITYVPMAKGFVYLAAILDLHSRKVLAWRTSNTLTTDFCVEALQEALTRFGSPEIFNTDQGSQFTAEAFTDVLKAQCYQHQHGWQGPLDRQRVRRAAVEKRQVRGHIPECLRDAQASQPGAEQVFRFLQYAPTSPSA